MKKCILLITLLFAATSAYASKNLLFNGDFSEGDYGWRGDVSEKKFDRNRCLLIRLDDRDEISFETFFQPRKKQQDFSLRCKYKTSSDYSGDGIRILLQIVGRGSRKLFERAFEIKPTEEWVTLKSSIDLDQDIDRYTNLGLQVIVFPGDGKIYFDDLELTGIPES